jgi:hypothetical protein
MPRSTASATVSLIGLALLLASPTQAERLGKGSSLVLVGIAGHTGQFITPGPFRFQSGEVGGHLAYYYFLSEDWALGVSGGYQVSRMRIDENNPNGTPFSIDEVKTRSFTVRVGGDRYAFIDHNVAFYLGPGLLFSQGRYSSEVTVLPPAMGGGTSEGRTLAN